MSKLYTADFETTTAENGQDYTRVWAFAICEVEPDENGNRGVIVGKTIGEFFEWCRQQKDNPRLYFHNLKFDSSFILDYLFKHGFTHFIDTKDMKDNTFKTKIDDKNNFYELVIVFKRQGKRTQRVTIWDSHKLIPMSVNDTAKAMGLHIQKLEIDYTAHDKLPEGSELTDDEIAYIKNDVLIMAYAIHYFHEQGLKEMTIGACAYKYYKNLMNKKYFAKIFPTPKYRPLIKESYRGGFTYVNPKFKEKTVGKGVVLDVNSLYPSILRYEKLPYCNPIAFDGEYIHDELYPLYIQVVDVIFDLKKGKLPTLQTKGTFRSSVNEYLESSNGEHLILKLTNMDLELFKEHYKISEIQYLYGFKFKATQGLFDKYIDHWIAKKIEAEKDGNKGLRLISKLLLNSLYGKYGQSELLKSHIPYLSDEEVVLFKEGEDKTRDPEYLPVATFTTSYARVKMIRSAQKICDDYAEGKSNIQWVYCDTDSLHLESPDLKLPEGIDIDPYRLGAFKHEYSFKKGKYLRQKCYIDEEIISEEQYDKGINGEESYLYSRDSEGFYKRKITVAGMSPSCYPLVTFENFEVNTKYKGKKIPKRIKGGIVLLDGDFTIHGDKAKEDEDNKKLKNKEASKKTKNKKASKKAKKINTKEQIEKEMKVLEEMYKIR